MLTPEQAERLASTAFAAAADAPGPRPTDRVGPYRIVRRIASGGMGTVYEATQEHPRRTVALKVLHRGLCMPKALRRFEHEASVMAHLHHPGIAQIYDAGVWDEGHGEVPYLVMQLVADARPITTWADAHDLSVRERVELFVKVCDAVHHGHRKGVIHRDLKPSNILVDREGEPRVIDFGVARATDGDVAITTMHTDAREIIGTLQYMSPEQCDGNPHDLDVRSDVYALGVVLYELLCGELPYVVRGGSIASAACVVREAEPRAPAAARRAVRGDLGAIVLAALEKRRAARYQSAADLAADLCRYLAGEPVRARPPTAWTRLTRWMGHHPLLTTGAACGGIVLSSVVLVLGTLWWATRVPYDLETTSDRREARLVTAAGLPLRSWHAGPGQIRVATTRDVDPTDRLGLLAFSSNAWHPEYARALVVFGLDDPDRPRFVDRLHDESLPPSILRRGRSADEFGVVISAFEDVFPEIDGPEVIGIFQHFMFSQCAVRIYDLQGKLLHQFWHDGNLRSFAWLPESRTLVLAGVNGEATWAERGISDVDNDFHPPIVLGVRPRLDEVARAFTSPDHAGDGIRAAWYWSLRPASSASAFSAARVEIASSGSRPAAHVSFVTPSHQAVGFVLDGSGNESGRRWLTNGYRSDPASPDPDGLDLGRLPPIVREVGSSGED